MQLTDEPARDQTGQKGVRLPVGSKKYRYSGQLDLSVAYEDLLEPNQDGTVDIL